MALKTVDVGPLEGRVCYVTLEGKNLYVTVEVASEQKAFRFKDGMKPAPREGEWVRFSGVARVQVVSKKGEPEELERILYYHQPYDGSDVREWEYFDLKKTECVRIGPLDILDSLQSASSRGALHIKDWFAVCNSQELRATCNALMHAHDMMKEEMTKRILEENNDTPASMMEVDI